MLAIARWRSSESGRKNSRRIEKEHGSDEALADEIVREVLTGTLQTRPIRRHDKIEPTNGKVRHLSVASVKQQVLDYVVDTALKPWIDARVGYWQVSGKKLPPRKDGKPAKKMGQRAAKLAAEKWVKEGGYHVHLDVTKCYASISHDVVMGILEKYVRGAGVLYICRHLLGTYGPGLDLGSFFSLRMCQLTLSFAYHHMEEVHKTRRGRRVRLITHQIWYADDIWLFSQDKRDLKMACRRLVAFMKKELGLTLKPWKVCRVGTPGEAGTEPVDIAGYRVTPVGTTVRKTTFRRLRRAFMRFRRRGGGIRLARRCASYWGYLKHTNSRHYCKIHGIGEEMAEVRATVSSFDRRRARCIPQNQAA